jgi:hypothetical protein
MESTHAAQVEADKVACQQRLVAATRTSIGMGINAQDIVTHCLTASGGASGACLFIKL